MRYLLLATLLAVAASFAGPAQAEKFPSWPLNATCDTADWQCPQFELRARGKVSGVWNTLPPDVQRKCIDEVKTLEPSYRLLGECLALEMQELLKNQQRKADDGEVVHDTPKAKVAVEQVAPEPQPEPQAPQAQPAPQVPAPPPVEQAAPPQPETPAPSPDSSAPQSEPAPQTPQAQ